VLGRDARQARLFRDQAARKGLRRGRRGPDTQQQGDQRAGQAHLVVLDCGPTVGGRVGAGDGGPSGIIPSLSSNHEVTQWNRTNAR